MDAQPAQGRRLGLGLDPFGNEDVPSGVGVVPQAGGKGLAGRVDVDVAHQGDVELHEVWLELQDVAEAGIAGPGIVHRDPHPRAGGDGARSAA